ncbi:MAG: SIMPL domain-containing protein [Pyrinomonadaceae bacterium]|nr:SIMPL domain-containing protein [Pyrinomonadaceae bacterium]
MKKFVPFVILVFTLGAFAQDNSKPVTIDVSGTAEVEIAPDEVIFSLDVTNTESELQKAKSANDAVVAKILALTKRFSISAQDVKTDYISVEKKFEFIREKDVKIYDEDGDEVGRKEFKGYEVSKTVIVRLRDLTRFEDFFSEVVNAGVSEINSVKFQTSKLREMKDRARGLAMKAAYEKASAMAGAIGQTIGKAVSVVEVDNSNRGYSLSGLNSNSNMTFGSFSPEIVSSSESVATFAPGAIKVEASVKVSFLLK